MSRFCRDNGTGLQIPFVKTEHMQANNPLLSGSYISQTQNPAMGRSLNDSQFTEIFVQGNQGTSFAMSAGQDLFVSRIFRPFASPYYVVAGCFEVSTSSTPHARIQKKLHVSDVSKSGSIRS